MSLTIRGYLENPHLATPYLASVADQTYGMQVQLAIAAAPATHMQASRTIAAEAAVHSQVSRTISVTTDDGMQVSRTIAAAPATGLQATLDVIGVPGLGSQVQRAISAASRFGIQVEDDIAAIDKRTGSQVDRDIVGQPGLHSQVNRQITSGLRQTGMQVMPNTFLHELCGRYLVFPYLTDPYLGNLICAMGRMQVSLNPTQLRHVGMQVEDDIVDAPFSIRMQVSRTINATRPIGSQVARTIANALAARHAQVQRAITTTRAYHQQVVRTISISYPRGMQTLRVFVGPNHMQTTFVLYNTTNLRVLDRFPSRGDGTSWIASSTEAGDFSADNLNNDIVEYYWRSATGVITGISLTNDSSVPQGVFMDTLGILGHNLTLSATVLMQSSQDPTFSTGVEEITLPVTLTNMFYIAPTLPASGYRYRRFLIDDPTNTDGFIKIGTIVYGAAIILIGDDIVDQIRWKKKHFKDVIVTEGYRNVSNDRALKRILGLKFRDMDFHKANYQALAQLFDYARTSLACLWIPSPQYPTRFAIFGKLTDLPDESHNDKGEDIDYVDFDLDIDESL